MNHVYVGTEKGLDIMAEDAGSWRVERTILAGQEISAVTKAPHGTKLYVATRRAGLFLVEPGVGTATPIGEGVLPKGLRCVAIAPSDPATMFVGCEPAAVYKSSDGGATWAECPAVAELARARHWQYHIPQIPPHIRQILIDRRSPQRLYAAVQIGGVIRSEDGGLTWQDVVDCLDPDVHAIAQDRARPDVLYASTGGGGPMGGPHPPLPPAGFAFYRSTDAGKTWDTISADLGRSHAVPIHLHPQDDATLVAAVGRGTPPEWRRPEGADAILVVSRDRGETWTQLTGGLPSSFRTMVDSIDTHAGRTYLGIGGEGTKVLPPEMHHGYVFYADRLEGPWTKLPREFPVVYTVTAA